MEQTKTTVKKTYEKYDDNHYLLYFNEQEETTPAEEGQEAQTAYTYDTVLAECSSPDKGCFVDAIIRSQYSESSELAIHRHYANDPDGYDEEWTAYNEFCEAAKVIVKGWGL